MQSRQRQGVVQKRVADKAVEFFDAGDSCTLAVLKATMGVISKDLQAACSGFHSGIGKSGCLCGALTGGVMALGLKGCGKSSGALVERFKEAYGTTCCRNLSRDYEWMSEDHQDNCRRITVATAGLVCEVLEEDLYQKNSGLRLARAAITLRGTRNKYMSP